MLWPCLPVHTMASAWLASTRAMTGCKEVVGVLNFCNKLYWYIHPKIVTDQDNKDHNAACTVHKALKETCTNDPGLIT